MRSFYLGLAFLALGCIRYLFLKHTHTDRARTDITMWMPSCLASFLPLSLSLSFNLWFAVFNLFPPYDVMQLWFGVMMRSDPEMALSLHERRRADSVNEFMVVWKALQHPSTCPIIIIKQHTHQLFSCSSTPRVADDTLLNRHGDEINISISRELMFFLKNADVLRIWTNHWKSDYRSKLRFGSDRGIYSKLSRHVGICSVPSCPAFISIIFASFIL